MSAQTQTQTLQIETPTWGDYRNGGHGDHVAQCTCGQHEYVGSPSEGRYWHWLHRTNAHARGRIMLRLLVDNPMPEGWTEPAPVTVPTEGRTSIARTYTCPSCLGVGSIPAYGTHGGRFYHHGELVSCGDCAGSGATDQWTWEGAKKIEAAA